MLGLELQTHVPGTIMDPFSRFTLVDLDTRLAPWTQDAVLLQQTKLQGQSCELKQQAHLPADLGIRPACPRNRATSPHMDHVRWSAQNL
jgi:hypothetical protein